MHEGVLARLELAAELQRALATEQLELHYQPIVDLADGSIAASRRWCAGAIPSAGLVPPDQFIPLAEETGLIVPIGRWVLREACRQARRMRSTRCPRRARSTMSVNLSAAPAPARRLVADVARRARASRPRADALTLEITESLLMADTRASPSTAAASSRSSASASRSTTSAPATRR